MFIKSKNRCIIRLTNKTQTPDGKPITKTIYSLAPRKMQEIIEDIYLYADSVNGNTMDGFTIYYWPNKQLYVDNLIYAIRQMESNLGKEFEKI